MSRSSLNAADGRALIVSVCLLAGNGPLTSVLICDDRPEAQLSLSVLLRPLPTLVSIACVSDGFALVDAHQAHRADLILIGFHDRSSSAELALKLILGMDPAAVVVTVGSRDCTGMLVDAYIRGARGMLLWDVDSPLAP